MGKRLQRRTTKASVWSAGFALAVVTLGGAVGYAATGSELVGDYSTRSGVQTRATAAGVTVTVNDRALVRTVPFVAAASPSGPFEQDASIRRNVPGVISVNVLANKATARGNAARATSSLSRINLLGGLVKADALSVVSSSFADGASAHSSSQGSKVVGLVVNGKHVRVSKPITISINDKKHHQIASLEILRSTDSTAPGYTAHTTTGLRLTLLRGYGALRAGAVFELAATTSEALCC
jgi:hypothetical protein